MPRPSFISTKDKISRMIRVDHAGEYGAKRIYQGQLAFITNEEDHKLISSMLEHEQVHLDYFEDQLKSRKIRPTVLMPLWHLGGYLLGAISGLVSIKSSMMVTENVEQVIEEHYQKQITKLILINEERLAADIKSFMDDEVLHKNIAQNYNLSHSLFTYISGKIVQKICNIAIFLSKKI